MNREKYYQYFSIILLCFFSQGSFAFETTGKETWKVLIYMQADNDLAPYAFWDLAELEQGIGEDVIVLAELDLPGDEGITRLKIKSNKLKQDLNQINFATWSLSQLKSEPIKTLNETEFTQDERLLRFLVEAEEEFPTDHTMVVVWGHGEGFGGGVLAQFGGVALDENPVSKLTIQSVNESLKTYQAIFNKKIDILSMDACLMQTLEVAIEFKGSVDYLIGSTQIQDFRGLPYHDILEFMQSSLESSENQTYDLAKKIPELFEIKAVNEFDNDNRTMSAINLVELENKLIPALNIVAKKITSYLNEDSFNKLDLLDYVERLPFFLGESRDLSALLSKLDEFFFELQRYELSHAIRDAMDKMHRSSVSYYYGDNYVMENRISLGSFKAFGVWLPSSIVDYNYRISDFNESALFKSISSWKLLLSTLYSDEIF